MGMSDIFFVFVFSMQLLKKLIIFILIIGILFKNKEEELNSIIAELRKSFASVQEKFTKEELDKMVSRVGRISNVSDFS